MAISNLIDGQAKALGGWKIKPQKSIEELFAEKDSLLVRQGGPSLVVRFGSPLWNDKLFARQGSPS